MKSAFLTCGVAALGLLLTCGAQAGSEHIIKQRAKDLRDQNNARQGVPPPARPAPGSQGAVSVAPQPYAPITLTPQQQSMARLQAALAVFKPGATVSDGMKQSLARELTAAARGTKPTPRTSAKAADSIAAALSQKLLSTATRNRIVKNLEAVLNPGSMPAVQLADVITDIQSQFKANGVTPAACTAVTTDLRALLGETRGNR